MRSFKSNENIHKKESGSYYVVSANKASLKFKINNGKFDQNHYIFLIFYILIFVCAEKGRVLKGDAQGMGTSLQGQDKEIL